MKDLLSKENYSYKIFTLLMKSSAYHLPPSLQSNTAPHFYKKTWYMIFSNIPTPSLPAYK